MNFNSLFQLDTLRRNNDSALAAADKLLFIPDALSYMLTGEIGNGIYHCQLRPQFGQMQTPVNPGRCFISAKLRD